LVPAGPSAVVWQCLARNIAVHSPHTALDVAPGGTCDMLADVVGLQTRRPLRPAKLQEAATLKLVTFVPPDAADALGDALSTAGAGVIGHYSRCSFRSRGTGTFFGDDEADPAVGQAGRLETVDEVRLETVVPVDAAPAVVAALREAHPYEEPAFDLYPLQTAPEPAVGMGRIGRFDAPMPVSEVLGRVKRDLGVDRLLLAGPSDRLVTTAAVCPGSCGDLLDDALNNRADFYLTGELRHHDALRAARAGMTVCCVLHSNSERAMLHRVADRLAPDLPGVAMKVSPVDRDPFRVV
jgi:hypothetical protein